MASSPEILGLTLLVSGLGLLGVAYIAASRLLQELSLHDLRVEAYRLRAEYQRRLEEIKKGQSEQVELLVPGLHATGADTHASPRSAHADRRAA